MSVITLTEAEQQRIYGGECCYCKSCQKCTGTLMGSYEYENYCKTACNNQGSEYYSFYKNLDKACWGKCNTWCRAGEEVADGFGILETCQDDCYKKCECASAG